MRGSLGTVDAGFKNVDSSELETPKISRNRKFSLLWKTIVTKINLVKVEFKSNVGKMHKTVFFS